MRFFVLALPLLCMSHNALAQPAQDRWALTVGAAPVYSPLFLGSKDYALSVFPDLRVNYGDDFFASVPDGVGYNVINRDGWKAGPVVKIRFSREEDRGGSPFRVSGETTALRGLGDVDAAGEAGGFVQYNMAGWRTRLEVRQGFGGHEGLLGDGSIQYTHRIGANSISIGPRATYGSSDFINTYYGINAAQSARSGLAGYNADGGLVSYGVGANAVMPVNDRVAVTFFGGYDRLGHELSDSPLIRQRGQEHAVTLGMAVGYKFDLGK